MPIINVQTIQPGLVGVLPSIAYIETTDTLATVLTTGYLNEQVRVGSSFSLPCMAIVSTKASASAAPVVGTFNVQYAAGNWSLTATSSPGGAILPTKVAHIATYADVDGTITEDPATAISGGNIQAGLSGTAGTLSSFPSTASKGSLVVAAVANTGNTITTLSNVAMGQASVVSIPDPANAVGHLLIGATATPFVSGNFPVNSGTAGVMVDSGFAAAQIMKLNAVNTLTGSGQIILVKANGTEASNAVTASGNAGVITTSSLTVTAGSTYAITWTNTKITSTSVIALSVMGGTNTNQNINFTVTAGTGTSTLTIYNSAPVTSISGTILIGYVVL